MSAPPVPVDGTTTASDAGPSTLTSTPAYVWCFLATIVFNIFSSHWDRLGVPLGLDRVSFAGGVVLLALDPWAWKQRRLLLRPVHVAMVGLLALATISAAGHGTLLNSYGLFALLDRLLVPFVMFCLAPVIFARAAHRTLLLKTLVLLGLYLGVTAVLETLKLWSLVFPSYIGDPGVGIQFGRARGPFAASEAMGMACAACFFAAALAVSRFRGAWRALSVAVVVLSAGGVLMSLTRSVWVGLLLGSIVAMALTPALRRYIPVALAGGAVVVVAALAVVPGLQESVTERAGTSRSLYDRYNTNEAALRIVEQEPLTGVGWVKFLDVSSDWVRQADTYGITNVEIEVHNVVLGRAAELGIPGAALFVGCVLLGPFRAVLQRRYADPELVGWRAVSTGMTAVWAVTLMLSPVSYPLPNTLTWLLAGIALIPYVSSSRVSEQ
ncbi:O-antigen ligase family protein [Kineococcus sp. SYSU DK002]|uniref:O-antigen ligase family protein n=1 Tax=Kineococcus sp. SYSU DK002 TaxID=3383123 RepID=UPI003D7CA0D7